MIDIEWIHLVHNFDGVFKLLEASSITDTDTDCYDISANDVVADTLMTVSYLETKISESINSTITEIYLTKCFRGDGAYMPDFDAASDGERILR